MRYPPARACRSPPVWRRGLRSMTLPVPEVRPSRASWSAGAASPLTSLEGKTVPRRRRLSLPLPPLPPRFGARARPGSSAGSRSPPPPRLARGRPPSASPAKPVGAVVVARPAGSRFSPDPARRVRDHPVLPGVAPRCRACVRGGPPRPHTRPRAHARGRRLGTSAWSVGAVCRAGARPSGGGSAVPGGWPLTVLATRHPRPAACPATCSARPTVSRRLALPPYGGVCVGGLRGIPVGSRGRPPPPRVFSRLSPRPPARVCLSPPSSPRSARSLARSVLGFARRPAGRPSVRPVRVVRSPARAPTWLILPVAYACLKD